MAANARKKRMVICLGFLVIIIIAAIIIVLFEFLPPSGSKPPKKTNPQPPEINTPIIKEENPDPGSRGGNITFSLRSGTYEQRVELELSHENLQSPAGDEIPSDVYYTLDGSDPTRENALKYTPGGKIILNSPGNHTIKAKLFSGIGKYEGPVYSQKYLIEPKPQTPPQTETPLPPIEISKPVIKEPTAPTIETITNFMQLDEETRKNVYESTKKIVFEVKGINEVKKVAGSIKIEIFISQYGKAKLLNISAIKRLTPIDKEGDFRAALAAAIQQIKFLPPTRNGNPVNVRVWIDFKKVARLENQIILKGNLF